MKKEISDAIEIIQNVPTNTGKGYAWFLLNGTEAYRQIFYELTKLIERSGYGGCWIFKKELLRRAKIPYAAASYPLYKLEREELISIKNTKIFIEQYQIENWSVLCGIIQSSSKAKK